MGNQDFVIDQEWRRVEGVRASRERVVGRGGGRRDGHSGTQSNAGRMTSSHDMAPISPRVCVPCHPSQPPTTHRQTVNSGTLSHT